MYCLHSLIHTVPTGPNLTESRPKPDLGFPFGVRSGSAIADPEQTPTGLQANPEPTPSRRKANLKSEPQFQKRTHKADPGSALRNRAVNLDY